MYPIEIAVKKSTIRFSLQLFSVHGTLQNQTVVFENGVDDEGELCLRARGGVRKQKVDLEALIVIVHLPETKTVEEVKKQGVQWPASLVPDTVRPHAGTLLFQTMYSL